MTRALIPLGIVLLLTGCTVVQSLHPVATEATAIYDRSLEGVWAEDGRDDLYILSADSDEAPKGYQLRVVDTKPSRLADGAVKAFHVTLRKIGDRLWADATVAEEHSDLYVTTHYFVRVEKRQTALALRMLLWSKIPAGDRPASVDLPDDKGILLTAETPRLLTFLERFGAKDEAFDDEMMLNPVKR
ncbi:MAG: hypothetical protein ABI995_08110 [Acidobacteriota bacterium]